MAYHNPFIVNGKIRFPENANLVRHVEKWAKLRGNKLAYRFLDLRCEEQIFNKEVDVRRRIFRNRNRAVMQLLWRGIAAYVSQHDVKLMFGCASFSGTDVKSHALALSYLHHYHLAPPSMRAVALPRAMRRAASTMPRKTFSSRTTWYFPF